MSRRSMIAVVCRQMIVVDVIWAQDGLETEDEDDSDGNYCALGWGNYHIYDSDDELYMQYPF